MTSSSETQSTCGAIRVFSAGRESRSPLGLSPALDPGRSKMGANLVTLVRNFSIQNRPFSASDGDVLDGCIAAGPTTRKLLRFDFLTHNVGNVDLHVGPPANNPSIFVWSASHGHYHLKDFNQYKLLNAAGQEVMPGFKQAFCLMDVERTDPSAPRTNGFYTCGDQGVSIGWSDVYSSGLPCQFIVVDGVPDGDYRLLATTNYKQLIQEDRYNDNSVLVGLRLQGNTVSQIPLVWSGWKRRGGILIARPKVVAWGPNRLDVFGIGTDAALYHMAWNGTGWSGWNRLGGILIQPVDAVSWAPNRLDVVGVGTDGALYHMAWNGSSWSGWNRRGGILIRPPKIVSWGPNRLDVFGIGTDAALYHMAWNGSSWSGWNRLGGILIQDVDAVAWGPNRLDVVGVGTDGALYHMAWNGSSWSGWNRRGGILMTRPSIVSWGPNRLDVFGIGTDAALYHMAWNGSSWSGWNRLGGILLRPVEAVAWGPNRLDVFGIGTDSALYHMAWNGSSWSGWNRRGGILIQDVSAASYAANRLDVMGVGTDSALYEMHYG
jgi:hypothetical protein